MVELSIHVVISIHDLTLVGMDSNNGEFVTPKKPFIMSDESYNRMVQVIGMLLSGYQPSYLKLCFGVL